MNGKVYGLCFIFVWLSVKYVVMSGNVVVKMLFDIQFVVFKCSGYELDDEEFMCFYDEVKLKYDIEFDLCYVVVWLWVDEIIEFNDICVCLIWVLEVCVQNFRQEELWVGVFQV